MAYHIQSSFSAGELDPSLHERTTFEKYKAGLATLRNAFIGKTGRVISRPGLEYYKTARDATAFAIEGFTVDSLVNETFIVPLAYIDSGHPYGTGTAVTVSSTTTLPAPLVAGTTYYVIYATAATWKLAVNLADAEAGTAINITTNGVGTHTITPVYVTPKKCIVYSPPFTDYLIEWGERYLRVYNVSTGTYQERGHSWIEADLPYIQFIPNGAYIYVLRFGKKIKKLTLSSGIPLTDSQIFNVPAAPTISASTIVTPTGYAVDYQFTQIINGEESATVTDNTAGLKLPINAGETNSFTLSCSGATEVRAYRRPRNGNAYGYIGSSAASGGTATFIDYGADADYTHLPPALNFDPVGDSTGPISADPRTGIVYQQKLILTDDTNEEAINASRTGFQNNFYREFPLASDSALTFKVGTKNNAKVLHFLDNGGLFVFTTAGVYLSTGALTPDNLSLDKKGNWVIDEKVPPLEVPGGVIFVDRSTNTIRSLIYSNEAGGYSGDEISIFSNHLFYGKNIVSWAFQDGDTPLIWVVMDDGTLNALTYQREHEMQAWSRHDTDGLIESVTVQKNLTDTNSTVYVVVNRDGVRTIEKFADRTQDDFRDLVLMDSAKTFKSELTDGGEVVNVVATDINDWSAPLIINSDTAIFTNTTDNGAIGTIFRFFDRDNSAVDLEVTAFTSTTEITVQPLTEFPADQASNIRLYKTYSTLTGLDHLNGKSVSILSDGYVLASPLNNVENYPDVKVIGGEAVLPGGVRGAIIHIGLPFAADVETLDIDTVEQKPTLLESKIINKLYLKIYRSRGIFAGQSFPENDYVENMVDVESRTEESEIGIIGGAAQSLITKRLEFMIPNDWKSNGRICLRQVDPLPFEILSIIPDMTVIY